MKLFQLIKKLFCGQNKPEPEPSMYAYVQCQGCGSEAHTKMSVRSITVKLTDPCKRCGENFINCHVTNQPTPPEWYGNWKPRVQPPKFEVGDRVKGSPTCGFHAGFRGVVKYIEPNGTLWVRRDGAGSDVYYKPHEVEHVERKATA
ncbi:hypothetical protein pf16_221 [Pseudomonas phage pf16]|uniref:Uncharacterized protein n=1 Tax=Pseudomonas phage pf16 TaxID=1815630 RepID=A0A1S5R484_9CAUD|nr:hypothetical protein FDG98_gp077 [Pseudomonas phage pf16]AND75144.1 hypothetical protein pf16_221 [Pseudomonas phage pf16]